MFWGRQRIAAGIAKFKGVAVTIIATLKGNNLEQNKKYNFC